MEKIYISEEQYGPLFRYIQIETITDINWNGSELWIDDLELGRYCAETTLEESFVNQFSAHVANVVSASFNKYNPVLEADSNGLRICIVHESCTETGTSISIRKALPSKRLNDQNMIQTGYCSEEIVHLLKNLVRAHANIVMIGQTGSGKTELLKYLTGFIPNYERAITIEDTPEIHYRAINPGKDCVALKVIEGLFDYPDAIKVSLRQFPLWILLSEARGTEVQYLMESLTTGHYCLTTLHTDDVRKIPSRIKNMIQDEHAAERIENDIYTFLDVAIMIKKKVDINGIKRRYIDQIGVFDLGEDGKKKISLIMKDGKVISSDFGVTLGEKFKQAEILDPFKEQN